jgi:tetratricopeptide (TPR) repeat protein
LSCPRCNAAQLPSQRYCVDCGWELGRAYPETLTAERAKEAARASAEEPGEDPADSAGAAPEAPAAATVPETHFVPEAHAVPETGAEPDVATEPEVAAPVAASQEVQPSDLPGEANEPEVETAPEPPVFRGLPTPANMTERGIRLFNLGRIQESIDQYTKAIALDPNYKEAWEYRAEAYARLGRGEQAEEDRRRLQALNAG